MTECKEITEITKRKYPLKVCVEISFESESELERNIKKIENDCDRWTWQSDLLSILKRR